MGTLVEPKSASELSIDQFMLFRNSNTKLLDELLEFYEACKPLQPPPKQQPLPQNRNADTDDEWKRREARNWLTDNKRNRDEDAKLYAQIRSVLNKLSDDNFEVLVSEIKKLDIKDEVHLANLSEVIFIKALDEPKFCVRYAKLAYEFACYKPFNTDRLSFRKSTITRCQIMFTDLVNANKDKAKGCMNFIAELYNCNLLPNSIICHCFSGLIIMHEKKMEDSEVSFTDCIYMFMKVLGERFWRSSNEDAKGVFGKVEGLIATGKLSNREKFALMDTMDLKKKYESMHF